jgi:hypothetical protein
MTISIELLQMANFYFGFFFLPYSLQIKMSKYLLLWDFALISSPT